MPISIFLSEEILSQYVQEVNGQLDCPIGYSCVKYKKEGFVASYGFGYHQHCFRGKPSINIALEALS